MKPNNITIDDLARMMQHGLDHVEKRMDEQFAKVDERFAKVDKHFMEVSHELKAIRKELLGVVYRPEFEDLQERVREMENLFASLKKKAA